MTRRGTTVPGYTTTDLALIRELASSGVPDRDIAAQLGRTRKTIRQTRNRNRIPTTVSCGPIPVRREPKPVEQPQPPAPIDVKHLPPKKVVVFTPQKLWCQQCDRSVWPTEASSCTSQWCSANSNRAAA